MAQNLERAGVLMCNLSQEIVDRTLLYAILRYLMEFVNWTAEQAMAALKIEQNVPNMPLC